MGSPTVCLTINKLVSGNQKKNILNWEKRAIFTQKWGKSRQCWLYLSLRLAFFSLFAKIKFEKLSKGMDNFEI